jgi:uncharacterized membrane protein
MNQHNGNKRTASVIAAAGLGALLMYLLDPQQGRRRVALARDQGMRLTRVGRETADAGLRDLSHRTSGLLAQLRGALRRRAPPSDVVLVERVRAQLGRVVSHPHAVEVTASGGCVTLGGPILKSEEDALLHAVRAVRGVREVQSRLDVHERAGRLPALQGGNRRSRPHMEFMQENWAPGPRLLALGVGSALAGYAFAGRGLRANVLGLLGIGLAARAMSNQSLRRLLGLSGGRRAVDIHKAIHIAAPRDTVFDLWTHYDNFPRFMSLVQEVRALDETRSHWVVKGPAGSHIEWDAQITERVRPELLAWRSEPGSPLQHAGRVRFEEAGDGTRVTLQMSYSPPGGALGHTLAALLGHDPKHVLDADLMRMKAFIETGVAPHDAAAAGTAPPAHGSLH